MTPYQTSTIGYGEPVFQKKAGVWTHTPAFLDTPRYVSTNGWFFNKSALKRLLILPAPLSQLEIPAIAHSIFPCFQRKFPPVAPSLIVGL